MNGEAVRKGLGKWTKNSIELNTDYMFSKGSSKYTFPKRVLEPEVTQNDVYNTVAAGAVGEFTKKNGRNSMLFAYGQTGTGKTHTMFGPTKYL
mmetsp:Transcript_31961/g.23106  ORF Transcript_31961/g.23106 Transcript_31961/m.23106 type:complete len:93 (+) Transcript_31961:169-447(+)